jgi:RNA polymerase sigma-70 factor (ECF subfamily)
MDSPDTDNKHLLAAQAVHGAFDLPEQRFLAHLRAVAGEHEDPKVSDVYLALACAEGDPRAIDVFEQSYGSDLRRALSAARLASHHDADDLLQELRRRLFVDPKKILEYRGHGDLRAWLRVVATRFALDVVRIKRDAAGLTRPLESASADALVDGGETPEMATLRERYQDILARSMTLALTELDPEHRNALREHYAMGLTVDQIANVHGIHRATAARRVQRAREALLSSMRQLLAKDHGLEGSTLRSVLALAQSNFHLSLERILGET